MLVLLMLLKLLLQQQLLLHELLLLLLLLLSPNTNATAEIKHSFPSFFFFSTNVKICNLSEADLRVFHFRFLFLLLLQAVVPACEPLGPVCVEEVDVDGVNLVALDPLLAQVEVALEGGVHVVAVSQVDAETPLVDLAEQLQELWKN